MASPLLQGPMVSKATWRGVPGRGPRGASFGEARDSVVAAKGAPRHPPGGARGRDAGAARPQLLLRQPGPPSLRRRREISGHKRRDEEKPLVAGLLGKTGLSETRFEWTGVCDPQTGRAGREIRVSALKSRVRGRRDGEVEGEHLTSADSAAWGAALPLELARRLRGCVEGSVIRPGAQPAVLPESLPTAAAPRASSSNYFRGLAAPEEPLLRHFIV